MTSLLESYDLDVHTMACDCHAQSLAAFAHLHQDISAVLPYMNSTVPGAVYDHAAQVLTCNQNGHEISLRPRLIAVSGVLDRADAQELLTSLAAWLNDTWERRAELVANTHRRQRPPAMTVYRLLPGGNCKACGESTCFNFAAKLSAGQAAVGACAPLLEGRNDSRRAALTELLSAAGY